MEEETKGRWFLIKHDCEAMFNVNTIKIIESFEPNMPNIPFRCPGCFKEIGGLELKKKLLNFCKVYTELIAALGKLEFRIEEMKITNEASDS